MNFKNTMGGPKLGSSGSRQVQMTSVVNTVTSIWVAKNLGNVITRCATDSLLRNTAPRIQYSFLSSFILAASVET